MQQQAIIFTKNNASFIASSLNDYTAEELLEEYDYMFPTPDTKVVLARDVLDSGFSSISYVVSESMFLANNPGIQLNDQTFTNTNKF